jgi:hypothetical protein
MFKNSKSHHSMGVGRNSSRGRNLCLASQQEHVESLISPLPRSKKSQPYTPRGTPTVVKTKKAKPRLTDAERLECFQRMHKWVYVDLKSTPSPEKDLRKKYPFLGLHYFRNLLKCSISRGSIFLRKPTGRPVAYGVEYDNVILECVREQRAKQKQLYSLSTE